MTITQTSIEPKFSTEYHQHSVQQSTDEDSLKGIGSHPKPTAKLTSSSSLRQLGKGLIGLAAIGSLLPNAKANESATVLNLFGIPEDADCLIAPQSNRLVCVSGESGDLIGSKFEKTNSEYNSRAYATLTTSPFLRGNLLAKINKQLGDEFELIKTQPLKNQALALLQSNSSAIYCLGQAAAIKVHVVQEVDSDTTTDDVDHLNEDVLDIMKKENIFVGIGQYQNISETRVDLSLSAAPTPSNKIGGAAMALLLASTWAALN